MMNSLFHISHSNALKIIDFAYFCFMMKREVIIFGDNLSNSKKIFTKRKVAVVLCSLYVLCSCDRAS